MDGVTLTSLASSVVDAALTACTTRSSQFWSSLEQSGRRSGREGWATWLAENPDSLEARIVADMDRQKRRAR